MLSRKYFLTSATKSKNSHSLRMGILRFRHYSLAHVLIITSFVIWTFVSFAQIHYFYGMPLSAWLHNFDMFYFSSICVKPANNYRIFPFNNVFFVLFPNNRWFSYLSRKTEDEIDNVATVTINNMNTNVFLWILSKYFTHIVFVTC